MTYRNILVHLDSARACPARVEAAIALALRFDAHLTGVFPTAEPALPGYMAGGTPVDLMRLYRERAQEQADDMVAVFRQACERAGLKHESRVVPSRDVDVSDVLSLHMRYADLAVLGQSDPEDSLSADRGTVENVILASGRPVILIPYIGARMPIGERVMVAWDAGREAARAVADAMPLLERADRVAVMVVDPHRGRHGEEAGADIALHLARHGVTAEVHRSPAADVSVGDVLLSRLADESIDLLVMGAYGHARTRELVMGGVTRTMLEHMTVPVFMAH